jgi:thiamine pyrophosphate-dependent acetolactate synthase large subunit-like protein
MSAIAATSAPATLTGGELIVRLLEAHDVDTVFGIPGVHTFGLYRGLAGSSLRHITSRHEQGAGFMADGYARATRKPGVCFLISGPGVTNAATAVGQAYSDSVPLLIIASVNARADLGMERGRLHEMRSQRGAMAALTGWAHTVLDASEIPAAIAQAFQLLNQGRPRPVYLEFPLDILDQPVPVRDAAAVRNQPLVPAPRQVEQAVAMLGAAQRPLVLVGGGFAAGADPVSARDDLVMLAEHIAAPVATTIAAKGCFPVDHPLSLDCALASEPGRALLAQADVVLTLGSALSETDHWTERLPLQGRHIRVDIEAARLADDYPADLGIHADAQEMVRALRQAFASLGPRRDSGRCWARPADIRARQSTLLKTHKPAHAALMETMRDALPADARVVSDMTQLAYSAYSAFPVASPRCYFHPSGFGTLGYALPAAIGAALAEPERAHAVLVGDGGLQFTLPELAVAREHALALPVIIYDNKGYGQIAMGMRAHNIPPVGVTYFSPDFQILARAYDCASARPNTLKEFSTALRTACCESRPTLIEISDAIADAEQ